jgi:anti-sigma28 factor (negative regulator of flagellin synthesis)
MRIDLSLGIGQATDSAGAEKVDTPSGGGVSNPELAADVANPSAEYIRAQALTATLSQLPEIRQEKVAALAELVRGGNYAVSPEQTAGALMAHLSGGTAA